MQSRAHSLIESITNVAIGYSVALASQLIIFPVFDIYVPITDNLLIGAWFTAITTRDLGAARGMLEHALSLPRVNREELSIMASFLTPEKVHIISMLDRDDWQSNPCYPEPPR